MDTANYVKAEDRLELSDLSHNGHTVQLDNLAGRWRNTNSASRGIVEVAIAAHGSILRVHAFGAADPGLIDWGEIEADYIYANNIFSRVGAGFTASYHFEFSQTHLQANWNQGLLVLASFTSFKDDSRRSNYFSREFFHRQ